MTLGWRINLPIAVLLLLHSATLLGGFLAPNSPITQNRHLAWAPPADLHFIDQEGRFHFRPFVYPLVPDPQQPSHLTEDRAKPFPIRLLHRGDAYQLAGLIPTDLHLIGLDPPHRLYLLGTDGVGRDVLARILIGGRVSLFTGVLAASLTLTLGTLLGGIAGYIGGRTDAALMRLAEFFLALPWLYLLLAVRAFLPLNSASESTFYIMVALIGLIGWAIPARLVRGLVLSAKERLFVAAARGLGATHRHVLTTHVLPQALPLLGTHAALLIPSYVLAEVTLSFLGLGVAEPTPSWGTLLATLQQYHVLASYYWMLLPSIPLMLTFLCYYSLNTRRRATFPQ